jgi:peroxiredoxin
MITSLTLMLAVGFCKNPVPAFSLPSTHKGATFTEKDLLKKPSILVFMKATCPANEAMIPNFVALQKSLGNTVQVVAFLNGNIKTVSEVSKTYRANFTMVADKDSLVIAGCGAKNSGDFTIVASTTEAKFPKIWNGNSQAQITEGLGIITKHGRKIANGDVSKFNKSPMMGCSL